jgi:hypothetical protein
MRACGACDRGSNPRGDIIYLRKYPIKIRTKPRRISSNIKKFIDFLFFNNFVAQFKRGFLSINTIKDLTIK